MHHQPQAGYLHFVLPGRPWPPGMEEVAMPPLWITCIVVLPVLGLVFYVVRTSKPSQFRLSAKVLKLLDISIEIDSQDRPGELPGNQPDQT